MVHRLLFHTSVAQHYLLTYSQALGCLLYLLCFGRLPFDAEAKLQVGARGAAALQQPLSDQGRGMRDMVAQLALRLSYLP